MEPNKLPTLKEIESGQLTESGKYNALNVLLNQEPPVSWLKVHPMSKSVKYLPIDKVEYLLTKIFIHWYVEILDVNQMINSVVVTTRLFYKDPFSEGKYFHQDGVGAHPIDTKSGSSPMDFDKINRDSVKMATPNAETEAIKDAAHKIGRIFGKDLNRKEPMSYDGMLNDDRFKNAELTEK